MNGLLTLESVMFDGDALEGVAHNGKVWIVVRPVCEALNVDFSGQYTKLCAKEWATVGMISTVGKDGKTREMFCVELDSFSLWLATIDANRVAEHVRPKLLKFQKEARQVLADHFLGRTRAVAPKTPAEMFLAQAQLLVEQEKRLAAVEQTVATITTERGEAVAVAAEAKQVAHAAMATATGNHDYYAVVGYARLHNRKMTRNEAARHGKALTAICKAQQIKMGQVPDSHWGIIHTYPIEVLDRYFGWVSAGLP